MAFQRSMFQLQLYRSCLCCCAITWAPTGENGKSSAQTHHAASPSGYHESPRYRRCWTQARRRRAKQHGPLWCATTRRIREQVIRPAAASIHAMCTEHAGPATRIADTSVWEQWVIYGSMAASTLRNGKFTSIVACGMWQYSEIAGGTWPRIVTAVRA